MIMEKTFDYAKALEELEKIARKVEDPAAGIGDIEENIRRADALIEKCRSYLRAARESSDSL